MLSTFSIFSLFSILLLLFLYSRRKYYILHWKLGGPFGYPIIGAGMNFYYQEKILDFMLYARNKYGHIFLGFLGLTPVLVVSEPVITEKLLTSTAFVNKSFIYNGLKISIGDGLFTSDYSRWNHHRKLLNPAFNHKILLSFYPIFNREAKVLINNLGKCIGKGPINMLFMLQKCTLDTACHTTMGKVMNFQTGGNANILESYHYLLKYTAQRIFIPWYVNDFLFNFATIKKPFDFHTGNTKKFVDELIEDKVKRANLITDKTNDDINAQTDDEFNITKSKNIFLDQAFKLMATNDFTAKDVTAESNTMVIAAFETTANVLYITLMCLAMYPKYQDKVFDEIHLYFPDKDIEITYDDTQQLIYLEMVINEAMRLFAPVPLIARKCTEDFDIGNGIIIPKGTQMAIDIFHMQRCEKIWGPKSMTFYPDHFLKDNYSRMHPYSFIPFTKGLRNCIGWRYGMMSLKVFLAQILRSYYFTTDFKFDDLKYVEDITLKFIETPLLEVHERNI